MVQPHRWRVSGWVHRAAILATCWLLVIGCVPSLTAGTRPLLKIGLVAPFEGLERPLGYEALQGVQLALAERNAAGGVEGSPVELVALNDFGEPAEAALQAAELAADPAVIGALAGWSDDVAAAVLPRYQEAGLAVAVPWSVSGQLANSKRGTVLVAASTERVAESLGRQLAHRHPIDAVLAGDAASAAPFLATSTVSLRVVPPPAAFDDALCQEWAARVAGDAARSPDALVLAMHGGLAGEVLRVLVTEHGWHGAAFGDAQAGSGELTAVASGAAAGLIFGSPAPAGTDLAAGAELPVGSRVSDLGPRAVAAYDAAQVLLDAIATAIQRDGQADRRAVLAALSGVRRLGLTGEIAFDEQGRRVDAPVWLYRLGDGQCPGTLVESDP